MKIFFDAAIAMVKARVLFLSMFGIIFLLNINYAILRSARNALAVADLGGGASSIPWFELCGTMPGAVLMTIILNRLLGKYSLQKVFFLTLSFFVLFFLSFSWVLYPLLPVCENQLLSQAASMVFFALAELWKIALLTVLFWGFINQSVSLEHAKKYYAPLMLGASIGTLAASPLIKLCTSLAFSGGSWNMSLNLMMIVLSLISVITGWLFLSLSKSLSVGEIYIASAKPKKSSIWESLQICFKSRYLMLLAWITIADYVAYSLAEVIFLDVLKKQYPDPREYCSFMGDLSFWNGLLTAISAIFIAPYLLKNCRWLVASLVTPVCLVVTEGMFFFALWHPSLNQQLGLLVMLGSILFCVVRAAKYTLFDTAKEISFLLLPPLEKMQGKLIVDGMCARLGRGGASFMSLTLIELCGSVLATVPLAGVLAMTISTSCVLATTKLSLLVDRITDRTKEG